MFALTLFLQDGLGLNALQAGLAFAPAGITFSAAALAGPRLLRRYGTPAVVVGSITTAAALATLGILIYSGHARAALPWIILVTAIGSLGNGMVLPALIGTPLVDVKPRQAGAGAGVLTTAQQFASSAGVAIVGTIFFAVAGRSHPASGSYADGMTAAAGVDFVLVAAVAALTALIARSAKARKPQERPDGRQGAGSPPSRVASASAGPERPTPAGRLRGGEVLRGTSTRP